MLVPRKCLPPATLQSVPCRWRPLRPRLASCTYCAAAAGLVPGLPCSHPDPGSAACLVAICTGPACQSEWRTAPFRSCSEHICCHREAWRSARGSEGNSRVTPFLGLAPPGKPQTVFLGRGGCEFPGSDQASELKVDLRSIW